MKPIAFVIPWYGESLKGGAEQFAWQFSHRLADRGYAVEVLTTCCKSFLEDWNSDHLAQGEETIAPDLLVRRFKVKVRSSQDFHGANMRLLELSTEQFRTAGPGIPDRDAALFIQENIRSGAMNEFIEKNHDNYQAFIFIPYMYGTTFDCLPIVADKAYLHPCLHDEVYAYLPQVEQLFHSARGILYNSSGEKSLAEALYGPGIHNKGVVVGGGVESAAEDELTHLSSIGGVDIAEARYFLCLGRRDRTKNTDLLVQAFRKFKLSDMSNPIRLFLAGPGTLNYTDESCDILDFGLVSEQEKESLLHHCLALMQPSSNESYSRTLMEAWLYGKPVGVHRHCLATCEPVEQSGGGWIADSEPAWVALLREATGTDGNAMDAMGNNGRMYAREYASWDAAMDRYEKALDITLQPSADLETPAGRRLHKIVQLTAGVTYGDAISNQAMFIRDHLRHLGYVSDIYVEVLDPQCAAEATVYQPGLLDDADAVIYHHSIGSSLSTICAEFPGPKALIYHNITPAHFYAPYDQHVASLLEDGRRELVAMVGAFSCLLGDSDYNANELLDAGAVKAGVLPIAVNPDAWQQVPCQSVLDRFGDGRRNILFVGRISPNKCQEELVLAFNHYRVLDPESRLLLVGGYDPEDKYYRQMIHSIEALGLGEDVHVCGKVSQQELHAFYRCSHLFWSMSEHEGFGVPLVESMWFDVPVMAYKSSAVPETLGEGGILFDDKRNLTELAFLASRMLHDKLLRSNLIAGQRSRRLDFHPGRVQQAVHSLVAELERQCEAGVSRNAV